MDHDDREEKEKINQHEEFEEDFSVPRGDENIEQVGEIQIESPKIEKEPVQNDINDESDNVDQAVNGKQEEKKPLEAKKIVEEEIKSDKEEGPGHLGNAA